MIASNIATVSDRLLVLSTMTEDYFNHQITIATI